MWRWFLMMLVIALPRAETLGPSPELVLQFTHAGYVRALALSADGRYVATQGADNRLGLWDLDTGHRLRETTLSTQALAWSPVGELLVCGGNMLLGLDPATLEILRRAETPHRRCDGILPIPDGAVLASREGLSVYQWGEQTRKVDFERKEEAPAALSPDARFVASGDGEVLRVFSLPSLEPVLELRPEVGEITGLAFSPDSSELGVVVRKTAPIDLLAPTRWLRVRLDGASMDGELVHEERMRAGHRVWWTEAHGPMLMPKDRPRLLGPGTPGWALDLPTESLLIRNAAITPDGRWMVALDGEGQLLRWALSAPLGGEILGTREDWRTEVVAVGPEGRLALVRGKGRLELWGVDERALVCAVELDAIAWRFTGPDTLSLLDPAGRMLSLDRRCAPEPRGELGLAPKLADWDRPTGRLIVADDEGLQLHEADGTPITAFALESSPLKGLALSPDAERVALWSEGGESEEGVVEVRALPSWALMGRWTVEADREGPLRLGPGGRRVTLGNTVHAADDGRVLSHIPPRAPIFSFDQWREVLNTGPRGELLMSGELGLQRASEEGLVQGAVGYQRVDSVAMDPDGRILVSSEGGPAQWTLRMTRMDQGATLDRRVGWRRGSLRALDLSDDGRVLLSAYDDGLLHLWDLEAGSLHRVSRPEVESIYDARLLPDGRVLLYAMIEGGQAAAVLFDPEQDRILRVDPGVSDALPSPDGRLYMALSDARSDVVILDKVVRVRDLETGEDLASWPGGRVLHAAFSPDGRALLVARYGAFSVHAVHDGRLLFEAETPWFQGTRWGGGALWWIGRDHQGRRAPWSGEGFGEPESMEDLPPLLMAGDWSLLEARRSESRPELRFSHMSAEEVVTLPGHIGSLRFQDASADGRLFVTGADDGTIRLHNPAARETLQLVASGEQWLILTEDGYFDASRDGGGLMARVDGLHASSLGRFAATRNRPDVYLERMGLGSSALNAHLRAVALGRLEAMGLDPDGAFGGEGPTLALEPSTVTGGAASIPWRAQSGDAALHALAVQVNGVPLFGVAGMGLSGEEQAGRVELPLLEGDNRVSVAVIDEEGRRSTERELVLVGGPRGPGRLVVLGFGVSNYRAPGLDLNYAAKDVEDLTRALSKAEGYSEVITRTWTNRQARAEALPELRARLEDTQPEDTVVVFFAGHGIWTREGEPRYTFLPHEVELDRLAETAVPFDAIEGLFDGIPARRRLLLLDTCESGRRDPDAAETMRLPGARGLAPRRARGLALEAVEEERIDLLDAARSDRGRFVYNDLSQRSGAVVFSAARGDEGSYERRDLQNGVFTEHLLIALETGAADSDQDGRVDIEELERWVGAEVAAMTLGLQHPTVDWDNPLVEIALPVSP